MLEMIEQSNDRKTNNLSHFKKVQAFNKVDDCRRLQFCIIWLLRQCTHEPDLIKHFFRQRFSNVSGGIVGDI